MQHPMSHPSRKKLFSVALALAVAAVLATKGNAQVTIYRDIFGNASSPVARQNPNLFAWQVFNQSGNALTSVGSNYAVDTTAGAPTNLVNVNAGFNSDGGSVPVSPGPFFWAASQAGRLSYTPEYSFNLSDYSSLTF